MSLAPRRFALLAYAVAAATSPVLVPSTSATASADPDITTQSASAVIGQLRKQGYTVEINGVPSGNTALLTNCTVTAIHKPGDAPPDPTAPDPAATTTVYVDVACPLQRG